MKPMRSNEWPDDNEVNARLFGAIMALEMEALDAPHIVVCRTLRSSQVTFSGPYPSGVEALAAAERSARAQEATGTCDLEFDVAPLFPPRD